METKERINIKELKAHKVFGPGYFIQRQIDVRGWTQKDLADVLGVSVKEVNYLLQNKQSITFETAQLLENAFGISAQTWLNHELRYRESKQKCEKKARQVKIKSPIYEYMPINEMVKKGWMSKTKSAEELEQQVMRFWNIQSVDFGFMQNNGNLRIACKKSETMQNSVYMRQMMWSKIRISEIRNDAFESLKYKDDNAREKSKTYVLYMYVLPLLMSVLLLVAGIFITNDIATYLITSISIFAGLFFRLLFVVTERYNAKQEQLKKDENEEVRNYLIRYKNFSKFLIRQISYTIVLALLLIFLMAVIYFSPQVPHLSLWGYGGIIRTVCKYVINAVIYFWSSQFIVFILVILGNTYVMLSDDINK